MAIGYLEIYMQLQYTLQRDFPCPFSKIMLNKHVLCDVCKHPKQAVYIFAEIRLSVSKCTRQEREETV